MHIYVRVCACARMCERLYECVYQRFLRYSKNFIKNDLFMER